MPALSQCRRKIQLSAVVLLSACGNRDVTLEPQRDPGARVSANAARTGEPDTFTFEADVFTATEMVKVPDAKVAGTAFGESGPRAAGGGDVARAQMGFHLFFVDSGGTVTVRYSAPRSASPLPKGDQAHELIDWKKLGEIAMSSDLAVPLLTLANGKSLDMSSLPFGLSLTKSEKFPALSSEQKRDQLRSVLRLMLRLREGSTLSIPSLAFVRHEGAASDTTASWKELSSDLQVLHRRTLTVSNAEKSATRVMSMAVTDARVTGPLTDTGRE